MTNNEPEFTTSAALPVQLCFFYDVVAGKISFSSSSPDTFFGSPPGGQPDPPFLGGLEGTSTAFLKKEWKSCLQLKDNEVKNFTIATHTPEGPMTFFFVVMRPASPMLNGSPLLTVSVTRMGSNYLPAAKTTNLLSLKNEYAEFIELAAHDLDSPLRKLSTLLDRITKKSEPITDTDMQGYFLRVHTCLADMRSLIENLTLLARLNNTSMKMTACDLESIMQTVLKDLEELPGEKNVKITPNSLPVVKGDTGQYKQLFSSLLENAFKFSKREKAAEIEIFSDPVTDKEKKLHSLPYDNSYVKIIMSDKGIGFRPEYAEKIFQPFVRLNGKSEYPGSGMGLALCKKIVENHGGIIYAEGDENFGARFILFLPLS